MNAPYSAAEVGSLVVAVEKRIKSRWARKPAETCSACEEGRSVEGGRETGGGGEGKTNLFSDQPAEFL